MNGCEKRIKRREIGVYGRTLVGFRVDLEFTTAERMNQFIRFIRRQSLDDVSQSQPQHRQSIMVQVNQIPYATRIVEAISFFFDFLEQVRSYIKRNRPLTSIRSSSSSYLSSSDVVLCRQSNHLNQQFSLQEHLQESAGVLHFSNESHPDAERWPSS